VFHSPNNFNPLDPDYDRNFSSLFHVGSALGDWYNYKNLPLTAKLLSGVYRDALYYIFKMKVGINRPRPYHLEPKLNALEKPNHQSYPSGHSSASYVNAYVLMKIAPALADSFLAKAAEMAISREYLGCHYPSDSEAGRLWARQFVNELFKKEKFLKDFEMAKQEILFFKQKSLGSIGLPEGECSASEDSCSESCDDECSSSCCK
jgi:acid phosphatase (class A)